MQQPPSTPAVADELITFIPLSVSIVPPTPTPISFLGSPPSPFTSKDLKSLNQLSAILLSATDPNWLPPMPQAVPNARSMQINKFKDEGNVAFRKENWTEAIKQYTASADLAASRPLFESNAYARDELAITLCNRSAAYLCRKDYVNALVDADAVILLKKPWVKGYFRRGKALSAMERLDEAKEALLLGLQFDPSAQVSLFFLFYNLDPTLLCY